MSCYNWEQGTIIMPRKVWASFRTKILKKWNQEQEELLLDCQAAHYAIVTATKGMRGEEKRSLAQNEGLHTYCGDRKDYQGYFGYSERYQRLYRVLFSWKNKRKLKRPKKKDMHIVQTSRSASLELNEGEATIGFDNDNRRVSWSVQENNRSVEEAHKNDFAIFFFNELSKVDWTRRSGGKIWGNDEYNRDAGRSQGEGGGGNYITMRFGPLGR